MTAPRAVPEPVVPASQPGSVVAQGSAAASGPAVAPSPAAAPATGGATAAPAAAPVPPSVRAAASWSWRVLVIAAAVALLGWLTSFFKVLVVSVLVAILLTVLLAPVVRWLHRRLRLPRGIASGIAVLGLVGFVVGLVALAGNSIINGFGELRTQALAGVQQLIDWLSTGPLGVSTVQLDDYVAQLTDWVSTNAGTLAAGALSVTTTVGQVAAGTLITLFCTLFFLGDGRRIWTWVVGLLPVGSRERVHQAGRRGVVTLAGYTRTQILVAFADSVGIGVGAAILGVPLALPIATLVFVGSFIPIVGALLTGTVAILVALVSQGPGVALIMLGVVLLVQQIEGNVLQPWLMGQAVSLHPVAVLLAVAAGSIAAGIVGALFAVPLVAVLNTVILYLHGRDKFPELGDGDHLQLPRPARPPVRLPRPPRPARAGAEGAGG